MGISSTPLYKCESCDHTSSNPYYFRIIEGRVKMGPQTLCLGYDFKPEVLCIECFCGAFGIGFDKDDVFCNDDRYKHINPSYTGPNAGMDVDPLDEETDER